MLRLARFVEGVDLQPAEVEPVAGRPDDGGDPRRLEVEREDRIGHAVGIGRHDAGLRLLRQVEAVARDIGVRLVEHREVVGVAGREIRREPRLEGHHAVAERRRAADERHAPRREAAVVDGLAAVGAADREGDVLGRRRRLGVPLVEHAEPPDVVAAAVAARRTVVRADRDVDAAAGLEQLLGDLRARGAGADDEDGAVGELAGVAVVGGMHLRDAGAVGDDPREDRALEGAGGGDDVLGLERALRGLDPEAGPAVQPRHRLHLDAAADRGAEPLGVGGEIVRDRLLRGEGLGVAVERHAGEAVVPGRAVRDQRIPSSAAPALGDAVPLQHEVGNAVPAVRCSLIATPAWPAPTTSASTFSTDIAGSLQGVESSGGYRLARATPSPGRGFGQRK